MANKSSNENYLSDFEYDLLWMSYRYCIGRHTIASHTHASNIAQYYLDRIRPEEKERCAADINNEIYYSMKFSFFKIENFRQEMHNPLDIFYEFINEENIESYNELGKYKSVTAKYDYKNNKWIYERTLHQEEKDKKYIIRMDYEDLDIWQVLSKLMNESNHKVALTKNNEEIKYIEVYSFTVIDNKIKYIKVKRPVDEKVLVREVRLNEEMLKQND